MIHFYFEGERLEAREGQSLAAALIQNQERITRLTRIKSTPRGLFCGIGSCFDCLLSINGELNQRGCITEVQEGMVVQIQNGN